MEAGCQLHLFLPHITFKKQGTKRSHIFFTNRKGSDFAVDIQHLSPQSSATLADIWRINVVFWGRLRLLVVGEDFGFVAHLVVFRPLLIQGGIELEG